MKTSRIFFVSILFLIGLSAGAYAAQNSASAQEQAVLEEINFTRTKPKEYVKTRLQPLVAKSKGTKLSALKELINQMNSMSALKPYAWGNGLYKASAEWVSAQGPTGKIGHGDTWNRIKKYCSYSKAGENCSYGYSQAVDIVIQLLIDDGTAGRGHRKNILNNAFTHVGAAIGTHAKYRSMCCMDFAGGYKEK